MIAVNGDEGDVTEQGTMDSGGREIEEMALQVESTVGVWIVCSMVA